MIVYRCDRCKKLMNKPFAKVEDFRKNESNQTTELRKYELCQKCAIKCLFTKQKRRKNEQDF